MVLLKFLQTMRLLHRLEDEMVQLLLPEGVNTTQMLSIVLVELRKNYTFTMR